LEDLRGDRAGGRYAAAATVPAASVSQYTTTAWTAQPARFRLVGHGSGRAHPGGTVVIV